MRWLVPLIFLGTSGCLPVSEAAICSGLSGPVASLRQSLIDNPNTPQPVGEAGTNVVLGFGGACK